MPQRHSRRSRDQKSLAGFTNTGYPSSRCTRAVIDEASRSHSRRITVRCFTMGSPDAAKSVFITALSIPTAEPTTPATKLWDTRYWQTLRTLSRTRQDTVLTSR